MASLAGSGPDRGQVLELVRDPDEGFDEAAHVVRARVAAEAHAHRGARQPGFHAHRQQGVGRLGVRARARRAARTGEAGTVQAADQGLAVDVLDGEEYGIRQARGSHREDPRAAPGERSAKLVAQCGQARK